MSTQICRIGFVATRLSGSDGVSLEASKWANVLAKLGHECFYFAGESEWPAERSYVVSEAHFEHPLIRKLNIDLFDDYRRFPETSEDIAKLKRHLKDHLYEYKEKFDLEMLIVENALSLPMNVPLGLALTEFIAETGIPTIAHHHDFTWERPRYAVSAAEDYLNASFPPTLNSIHHVVINSFAERQLALRTGTSSTIIPNVMDFEAPPPEPDGYAKDLRVELEIPEDAHFLLQPTRIVPRKRIEQAIELTRRLENHSVLVITHHSGDEGTNYENYLREYANLLHVDVRFAAERFAPQRGTNPKGEKIYSLEDAYRQTDLVTYPSIVEGFGNAFLETLYYCRPIVMSSYEIFKTDIQPKGFKVITFEDYVSDDCVDSARRILENPDQAVEMTGHNYELGKRHYSFNVLERSLESLISSARQ